MVNERYGIAIAETLYYLKGISQNDIDKIPNYFMTFLKNNASQDYECKFDYTRPLKELNLKNETRGLIAMICLNYWCETEEQKNSFREHLNKNEKQYREELRKKYNIDVFENRKNNEHEHNIKENINVSEVAMVDYKDSAFRKILNKIKSLFNI